MPAPPRSTLVLNFLKGLRTSTDPKLQLEGELTQLLNSRVTKQGAISKRPGYTSLSRSTFAGGTVTNGAAVQTSQDELLLFDGYAAYAWSPALTKWVSRGIARSATVSSEVIIRNDGYQQTAPSVAVNGDLEVHVWADERGGYRYTLIDTNTRSRILADQAIDTSNVVIAKAVAFASHLLIVTWSGTSTGTLAYRTVTTAGVSSATTLATTATTCATFDLAVVTSGATQRLFFVYNNFGVTSNIYLSSSLVASSSRNVTPADASTVNYVSCFADTSARLWVSHHSGLSVYSHAINFDNDSTVVADAIQFTRSAGVLDPYRVTGYWDSSASLARFYCEHNASNSWEAEIWTNTCNASGTRGTDTRLVRSLGILSKPFEYDSRWYMVCAHESDEQSTYFALDVSDRSVVARLGYQTSGGLEALRICTEVTHDGDGYVFAGLSKGRDIIEDEVFFSRLGVKRYGIDFETAYSFLSYPLNQQLIVTGGVVQSYDRSQFVESNFFLYPENITAVASNGAGTLTSLGVYQYKIVYSATDAAGNVHESRPCTIVSITLGGTDDTVTLTIPTLKLTARPAGVKVDIYRTQNGQSVFRKVTSSVSPTYNDTSVNSITFVDTTSDAALDALPLLYTEGELENCTPPHACLVAAWKSRLFFGKTEEPDTVWFSKLATPGIAAELVDDDAFRLTIDPVGGPMTAIVPMDSQLCIFRESSISIYTAEGPENTGTTVAFNTSGVPSPQPVTISQSLGCAFPGVITDIPQGLIFPSLDGIWLLGRDRTLSRIGDPVAAYDGYTFTSVDHLPNTSQVVFTTEEGTALVYDYRHEVWGEWTTLPANDGTIWQDQHVILKSDGYAMVQDDSVYQDDSTTYDMVARTSWFFPAGIGGFCQLDSLTLMGEYLSSHQLVITIETDNIETASRTYTISSGNLASLVGASNQYVIRVEPRIRCESFRITLTATGSGACANWSGLRAEIAPMPGSNRIAPHRRSSA